MSLATIDVITLGPVAGNVDIGNDTLVLGVARDTGDVVRLSGDLTALVSTPVLLDSINYYVKDMTGGEYRLFLTEAAAISGVGYVTFTDQGLDTQEIVMRDGIETGPIAIPAEFPEYDVIGWILDQEYATSGDPTPGDWTVNPNKHQGISNRASLGLYKAIIFVKNDLDIGLLELQNALDDALEDFQQQIDDAIALIPTIDQAFIISTINADPLKFTKIEEAHLDLLLTQVQKPNQFNLPDPRFSHTIARKSTGEVLVAGGSNGNKLFRDSWTSSPGIGFLTDWTLQNRLNDFSARQGHVSISGYQNGVITEGYFIFGGQDELGTYLNDNYFSSNGLTFTTIANVSPFTARVGHCISGVMDGSDINTDLYITGGRNGVGYFSDVWKTVNGGVNWALVGVASPYSARADHGQLTSDSEANRIYIAGGFNGTNYLNDVVYSDDFGVNWNTATASAEWPARKNFLFSQFHNGTGIYLYVIGGEDANGDALGDVWVSSDSGVTWTEVTVLADFGLMKGMAGFGTGSTNPLGFTAFYGGQNEDNVPKGEMWYADVADTWDNLIFAIFENFNDTGELALALVELDNRLTEFITSLGSSDTNELQALANLVPSGFPIKYEFPKDVAAGYTFDINSDKDRLLCVDDGSIIQANFVDSLNLIFRGTFFDLTKSFVNSGIGAAPTLLYATERFLDKNITFEPDVIHYAPEISYLDLEDDLYDQLGRQDLVFLEFWEERIKPLTGVAFANGNVQRHTDSVNMFEFDPADSGGIGVDYTHSSEKYAIGTPDFTDLLNRSRHHIRVDQETGFYTQWRFRIRVVEGETDIESVTPQGSNVAPEVDTYYFRKVPFANLGQDSDPGIYTAEDVAGNPHSTVALNQTDNTYAIPICLLHRKNKGVWHPDYNPNGTARITPTVISEGIYDFSLAGITSVNDCFNPANIAVVRIEPANNGAEPVVAQWDSATALGWTDLDIASKKVDFAGTWYRTGSFESTVSGRPDNLFYDYVQQSDILDLRSTVDMGGFSLEEMMNKNLELLFKGDLKTSWENVKRYGALGDYTEDGEIYGSTILQADTIVPEGITAGVWPPSVASIRRNVAQAFNNTHSYIDGARTGWSDEPQIRRAKDIVLSGFVQIAAPDAGNNNATPLPHSIFNPVGVGASPALTYTYNYVEGSPGTITGIHIAKAAIQSGDEWITNTSRVRLSADINDIQIKKFTEPVRPWNGIDPAITNQHIYKIGDTNVWKVTAASTLTDPTVDSSDYTLVPLEDSVNLETLSITGVIDDGNGSDIQINFTATPAESMGVLPSYAPDAHVNMLFIVKYALIYEAGEGLNHQTKYKSIVEDHYGYNLCPEHRRGHLDSIHLESNSNMDVSRYYGDFNVDDIFLGSNSDTFDLTPAGSSPISLETVNVGTQPFTSRADHAITNHNGILYLVGGYFKDDQTSSYMNDVWTSTDGETWEQLKENGNWIGSFPKRRRHQLISDGTNIYLIGGEDVNGNYLRDLWTSNDNGVNWTQLLVTTPFEQRIGFRAIVFGGDLYVIGGQEPLTGNRLNDVWVSSDSGVTWEKTIEGNAPWVGRGGHEVINYNGKLWIFGGHDSTGAVHNDIYSSSDGISWTFEGTAAWSARAGHKIVNFSDTLFLIHGTDDLVSPTYFDDVWTSSNGILWVLNAGLSGDFEGRTGFFAEVLNGKIIVGGGEGASGYLSDVWETTGVDWTQMALTGEWSGLNPSHSVVFNGYMYVLLDKGSNQKELWRFDGVRWERRTKNADLPFNNLDMSQVRMIVFANRILFTFLKSYAGVLDGSIWNTVDGSSYNLERTPFATGSSDISAHTIWTDGIKVYMLSRQADTSVARYSWDLGESGAAPLTSLGNETTGATQHNAQMTSAYFGGKVYLITGDDGLSTGPFGLHVSGAADNFATNSHVGTIESLFTPGSGDTFLLYPQFFTHDDGGGLKLYLAAVPENTFGDHDSGEISIWRRDNDSTWTAVYAPGIGLGLEWAFDTAQFQDIGGTVYAFGIAAKLPGYIERISKIYKSDNLGLSLFSEVTGNLPFGGRAWFAHTVTNTIHSEISGNPLNYIVLQGGRDATLTKNETYVSNNGLQWYRIQNSTSLNPASELTLRGLSKHSMTSLNGALYLAGGLSSTGVDRDEVFRSIDGGVTWTAVGGITGSGGQFSARRLHKLLTFNPGDGGATRLYLIGGSTGAGYTGNNEVYTSFNGSDWQLTTLDSFYSARSNHAVCEDGTYIYLSGGTGNDLSHVPLADVWRSDNGMTWERMASTAAFGKIHSHQMQVFNSKLIVFAGADHVLGLMQDVFESSNDGVTWTNVTSAIAGQPTFSPRHAAASSILGVMLFLCGGYDHQTIASAETLADLHQASTSIAWTEITAIGGSPWAGRFGHGIISFQNKMWIIGGYSSSPIAEYKNDVWSSEDGVIWELEVEDGTAPWTARNNFGLVEFYGMLWLFGGEDAGGLKNDVWVSTNGTTWVAANVVGAWTARTEFGFATAGTYIYVVGGNDGVVRNQVYRGAYTAGVTPQITWTTPGNGGFAARQGCRLVAHDNMLYLHGGRSGATYFDDTWSASSLNPDYGFPYTNETATFSPLPANTPTARFYHNIVSKDSRLWMFGGNDGTTKLNDIWILDPSSSTPVWTELEDSSSVYSERDLLGVVVFDNRIWINSGRAIGGLSIKDMYYSSTGIGTTRTVFLDDVLTPFWKGRDVYITPAVHTDGKRWMWQDLKIDGPDVDPDLDLEIQRYTELGPEGFMDGVSGWGAESGAVQCLWDTKKRSLSLINEHTTKQYTDCLLGFVYSDNNAKHLYNFDYVTKGIERIANIVTLTAENPEATPYVSGIYGFAKVSPADTTSGDFTYNLDTIPDATDGEVQNRVPVNTSGFFGSGPSNSAIPVWVEDVRPTVGGEPNQRYGYRYLIYAGFKANGFNNGRKQSRPTFEPTDDKKLNMWFFTLNPYTAAVGNGSASVITQEYPGLLHKNYAAVGDLYTLAGDWHDGTNLTGVAAQVPLIQPGFRAIMKYVEGNVDGSDAIPPNPETDDNFISVYYMRDPRVVHHEPGDIKGILGNDKLILSNAGSCGHRVMKSVRAAQYDVHLGFVRSQVNLATGITLTYANSAGNNLTPGTIYSAFVSGVIAGGLKEDYRYYVKTNATTRLYFYDSVADATADTGLTNSLKLTSGVGSGTMYVGLQSLTATSLNKRESYNKFKLISEFINTTRPSYLYDPNGPLIGRVNIPMNADTAEGAILDPTTTASVFHSDSLEYDTSALIIPVATMVRNFETFPYDFQRVGYPENPEVFNYKSSVFNWESHANDTTDSHAWVATDNTRIRGLGGTYSTGTGPNRRERDELLPHPIMEISNAEDIMWLSPNVYVDNGKYYGVIMDYNTAYYLSSSYLPETEDWKATRIDSRFILAGRPIYKNKPI